MSHHYIMMMQLSYRCFTNSSKVEELVEGGIGSCFIGAPQLEMDWVLHLHFISLAQVDVETKPIKPGEKKIARKITLNLVDCF